MKTYDEIRKNYNGKVPYSAQLETKEWNSKRSQIIHHFKNVCQDCGGECIVTYIPKGLHSGVKFIPAILENVTVEKQMLVPYTGEVINYSIDEVKLVPADNPLIPHVHHKYYFLNALAWEYPDDALVLLCHKCHFQFHKENTVPIYLDENMIDVMECTPCSRCFGAGHFPEYNHIQNGVCFRCNGARYEELIEKE